MTIPELSCDAFAERLADFLERDVDEATRVNMEAHGLACADCGSLLADLRRLRVDAANLPELEPSVDLWAGIAERIQTPIVALEPLGIAGPVGGWNGGPTARRLGLSWLGLAAAALVIVTASVTHELTKRGLQPLPSTQVAAVALPSADTAVATHGASSTAQPATDSLTTRPVIAPRRSPVPPATSSLVADHPGSHPSAQQTYETEIASLRLILDRRRPQLDSTTVVVVEHNLAVIDDAIAQCKAALKKDPASRFLMESLNDAMDDKVQLLRTAAVLPLKT